MTLARLTTRVWTNPKLTRRMKMAVYSTCVISTLLYASETWTTYAKQERRLNTFHMRSLRHILARQSDQRRGPVPSWPPYFVHPAQTAQTLLAGPRPPHGRWAHPKRHPLWRAGIWKEKHRPPAATLQGCREERYEGTQHQHRYVGRHRS